MSKGVDWSALIGGLIGAGIPTSLAAVGLRRQRQTADAEAFGPAVSLLARVDPDRVLINLGPDTETEVAELSDLEQRVNVARERLLVVAAGHPRRHVRDLARAAEVKLAAVFHGTGWAVIDMMLHRDNPEWMAHARQTYAEADKALNDLIEANFWSMRTAVASTVGRVLPGSRRQRNKAVP